MAAAVLILLTYVAGSVNFAILTLRLIRKPDPRTQFSGNAGTTNVYRQAGLIWAAAVLLLDVGRALAAAGLSVHFLSAEMASWVGFSLVAANRFPCFHGFRGGKGVAGYLGFTLLLAPVYTAIAAAAWVIVYRFVRLPFIASMFMVSILAFGTIVAYNSTPLAVAGTLATALLIFCNHWKNVSDFLQDRGKEKS